MQWKCDRPHFILASVVLLILTTLMISVDAQAQIAFVSNRSGNWDIYVMDANGQNPRKLTDNNWLDNSPSWSPDGKHIAFASTELANWDIYVMAADGGNPQNLTNNPFAHDRQPVWYRPAFAVAPADKRFTMWGWLKQIVR